MNYVRPTELYIEFSDLLNSVSLTKFDTQFEDQIEF